MSFATILPRFLPFAFQPGTTPPQRQHAAAMRSARRTLPRHAIVPLENRPLQLRVLRGWVWITRDGCAADTVLGAGEVFEQRPGARVLVQALEEAEVSIAADGGASHNS